jgi:hypothetical protein
MSGDIVKRLRVPPDLMTDFGRVGLFGAAAVEIERLRARVAVLAIDRRERIATACLAGLLADPNVNDVSVTDTAVRFADALIARLDKEVKP